MNPNVRIMTEKVVDRAASSVSGYCGHDPLGIVLFALGHLFEKTPLVLRTRSNLGAIIAAPLGSTARLVLSRTFDFPLPFLVREASGSVGNYLNELRDVCDVVGIDYKLFIWREL